MRLLTNLRYLGRGFNPVSFYYCYDRGRESVEAVIAEVTNIPWGERHAYVVERSGPGPIRATSSQGASTSRPSWPWTRPMTGGSASPAMPSTSRSRISKTATQVFDATLVAATARALARAA